MIDLHIHSTLSDGNHSIYEIENLAKEKEIEVLSVTDHDSIESSKLLSKHNSSLLWLPGTELSTETHYFNEKHKVHLLGYGYDYNNEELNKLLQELHQRRASDHQEYLEELIKKYKYLSKDFFIDFPYGQYGWLYKMVQKQLNNKISQEHQQELVEHIKENKPVYHKYNTEIEDALSTIKQANGYTVLAHPFELKMTQEEQKEFIDYLVSIGLDGIETYHNDASKKDIELYHMYAKKYNLLETGGSDFHRLSGGDSLGCIHQELTKESPIVKKLIYEKRTVGGRYDN